MGTFVLKKNSDTSYQKNYTCIESYLYRKVKLCIVIPYILVFKREINYIFEDKHENLHFLVHIYLLIEIRCMNSEAIICNKILNYV